MWAQNLHLVSKWLTASTLPWRHNGCDCVSNHQPHNCLLYSDADQRKHQNSASLAFVRGIHRGSVNSPHKWPVMWKILLFDDVIMMHWISSWNTEHVAAACIIHDGREKTKPQGHWFAFESNYHSTLVSHPRSYVSWKLSDVKLSMKDVLFMNQFA